MRKARGKWEDRRTLGRQGEEAPFPGAPRRHPAVLGQQRAQLCNDRVVLLQKGQQCPRRIQTPNDHDHQGFDEQLIGVGLRSSPLALHGGWGKRQMIHQADQADKNAVAAYHSQYLLGFELGTEMLGRRARAGKPGTRSSSQFNNLRFVTTSQLGGVTSVPRFCSPSFTCRLAGFFRYDVEAARLYCVGSNPYTKFRDKGFKMIHIFFRGCCLHVNDCRVLIWQDFSIGFCRNWVTG